MKTEQALVRIARPGAWSGSLTTASLVTPHQGRSRSIDWSNVGDSLRRHAYAAIAGEMMSRRQTSQTSRAIPGLNLNAVGIDVGATSHFVAVPQDRVGQPVLVWCIRSSSEIKC